MDGIDDGVPFTDEDRGTLTTTPRRSSVSVFESRLLIARFSVPEGYQSSVIDRAIDEFRAAGAAVYTVELAGAGAPLLDTGEVTYVGEREIQEAVTSFTCEGCSVPSPRIEAINDLAQSVAKSISEQLRAAGSYTEYVWVDVPQIQGVNPHLLGTWIWRDFSHNVQYATTGNGQSRLEYLHLKHFKLEIDDGRYTGRASGRLIDDTWSL